MSKITKHSLFACCAASMILFSNAPTLATAEANKIIHDAEYYIIEAQNV
jgi:hypothetical protein